MQNSKQIGSVVGALAVGAAAGAVLGLLFAPHKGTKTRNRLARNAKKLAEKFQHKTDNKVELLEGKVKKLSKNIKNKTDKKIDDLKDNANDLEGLLNKQVAKTTKTLSKGVEALTDYNHK